MCPIYRHSQSPDNVHVVHKMDSVTVFNNKYETLVFPVQKTKNRCFFL